MRVAHVITRLIVGGAQENTVASVLGLRGKPGLEVSLISGPTSGPEGSLESAFADAPDVLTIVPELVRPVVPWRDWLALKKLTELCRARRPDIVHTHSGKAGVLGRLAAARAGVPVIIHTIHGPSFGPFQGPLRNLVFQQAERHAAKVTTHFVSVADAMTEQYLAAGIGRPGQFSTIFSGFSLESFLAATNDPALRARLGIAPGDVVLGMIARFCNLKGHDDLFEIAPELAQQCPTTKFLLVGDGPWRRRFEDRAQALGLKQHFVFTGLVRPVEVPPLMGIMDAVVHLSRREGLARALPQALAAGKPVVAYDCDGAKEVCIENETGFLVSPGDLPGLTQRLVRVLRDPGLRKRFGEAGRALVQGRFGVQHMVDELHRLYVRLSAAGGSPKGVVVAFAGR
jgi:glycosyltransferase involved in cell wall biosynthesis